MAMYLNIIANLNIKKFLNIVVRNLENIQLKKRDKSLAFLTFLLYVLVL